MATTTKKNSVTVTLSEEKQTKNTVRFTEKLESEYDVPVIGTLYVPKATLAKLGYKGNAELVLEISVK